MKTKRRFGKISRIVSIVFAFGGFLGTYSLFDYIIVQYVGDSLLNPILQFVCYTIMTALMVYTVIIAIRLFNDEEEIFDKQKYMESMKSKITSDKSVDKSPLILNLMIDNIGEIREYFSISKSHAKRAFLYSVVFAGVGLVAFLSAIFFGVVQNKMQPTIISAVAASTVEIISVFFLNVFKNSQKQLHIYYSALHENEKFLSAVSLVEKLSESKRDEVYTSIISETMKQLYDKQS